MFDSLETLGNVGPQKLDWGPLIHHWGPVTQSGARERSETISWGPGTQLWHVEVHFNHWLR